MPFFRKEYDFLERQTFWRYTFPVRYLFQKNITSPQKHIEMYIIKKGGEM